jgi:hypothetical protein
MRLCARVSDLARWARSAELAGLQIDLACPAAGHAGVGVAELGGDDAHWHPAHGEMRTVGMAQDVEIHRWRDSGALTRLIQGPLLVGGAPDATVGAQEHMTGRALAFGPLVFENPTSTPSSAGVAMSRLLGAAQRDHVGAAGSRRHPNRAWSSFHT